MHCGNSALFNSLYRTHLIFITCNRKLEKAPFLFHQGDL
jgi:hypothetical protein